MRKSLLFGLVFVVVLGFVSFKTVQAVQEEEVHWKEVLQKAHHVQAEFASKQVSYSEVRQAFIECFTKEAMMTVFVEHLIMDGEVFQFGTTDFSPYVIPKDLDGFSVIEKNKRLIVVKEEQGEPTELMGSSHIRRMITITKTSDGWRISKVEWDQEV